MPERRDEFEDGVREGLEGIAREASPRQTAPPAVLASARRRIAWNSAAVVGVVAMITAVAVGIGSFSRSGGAPPGPIGSAGNPSPALSAPTTSSPSGAPATSAPTSSPTESASPNVVTSIGPWIGSTRTIDAFFDGVVYFLGGDPGVGVVGVVPDDTAVQPPVSTPFGVLVLGGRAGYGTRLWLLPPDRPRELVATGLDGFAVSADGTRATWATVSYGPIRSTLQEVSLADLAVLHSTVLTTYVQAVGYVGDTVLLDTGDGAGASAATWLPGGMSIGRIDGYGRVVATDPGSGFAVLTEGDGACWEIVPFGPTGNAGRAGGGNQAQGCGIGQASFDPGGEAVTAIELISEDRSGPQRFVLAGTTSQLGGEVELDGAFQTWWARPSAGGPGSILVLSEPEPGTFAILECHVSENLCPSDPVWTGTGAGGEGSAWIAEERPART